MNKMVTTNRVISGTHAQVWLDGELAAEAYGLQAKISYNKEEIPLCGQMGTDTKVMSYKGTGSLKLRHVYSRMVALMGDAIRNGRDKRFTIVFALNDPDAYGSERMAIKNVSFDDLTLADFEAGQNGRRECPFTFTDYDLLDTIGVQ